MLEVINNNSIKDYSTVQQLYSTVIIFYKSLLDNRGTNLYFDFYNYSKQYIYDQSILFLMCSMDTQKGRQFAKSRNIYGVPTLMIYKDGMLIEHIGGIPLDIKDINQLKNKIKYIISGN